MYINVKDKTVFNHEHGIACYAKCPEVSYTHDYVGESGRWVTATGLEPTTT